MSLRSELFRRGWQCQWSIAGRALAYGESIRGYRDFDSISFAQVTRDGVEPEICLLGAGDGIRTRDINLGKVALYQLSYSRLGATDDILV